MRICSSCGWSGLPIRNVCPACSGIAWSYCNEVTGTVKAVTRVHRAFGKSYSPPSTVVLIELTHGGWLIASARDAWVGAVVSVSDQGDAQPI